MHNSSSLQLNYYAKFNDIGHVLVEDDSNKVTACDSELEGENYDSIPRLTTFFHNDSWTAIIAHLSVSGSCEKSPKCNSEKHQEKKQPPQHCSSRTYWSLHLNFHFGYGCCSSALGDMEKA